MATHTADYIPRSDKRFNSWSYNLVQYILAHSSGWNIPANPFSEMEAMLNAWQTAFEIALNPEIRTKAAVTSKNEARKTFEAEIRRLVRAYISYNPYVTDSDRINMALSVHRAKPAPPLALTDAPVVDVDFSQRQQHAVNVRDIARRARPAGVNGFELWSKVGTPAPTTDNDFRYAGFSSKYSLTVLYDLEDVSKTVYYRARWVNVKNEPGPWSEIATAVVA